jgi:hypothetical protein
MFSMLPKLDEFIEQSLESGRGNAYVREPGFLSLYVRMGPRYLNGVIYKDVFDIASVLAKKPGAGAFFKLARRLLDQGLILYVESVQNPRFAEKLLREGFTQEAGRVPPSFYKFP